MACLAGQTACTEKGAPQQERAAEVTMDSHDQNKCLRLRLSCASFIQPGGNWHGRSHERNRCLGYSKRLRTPPRSRAWVPAAQENTTSKSDLV